MLIKPDLRRFLTHVGHFANHRDSQRRFAPTLPRFTGIGAPLHRNTQPEGEATLDIVGRETEERTLAMRFEREPLGWRVLGDDDAQALNSERRQVLDLLREDGGLTPAQIAAELGKSRPAVRMMLKRMKDDGQVKKQGSKYFPTRSDNYGVTSRED